jgi:hypothetical protein
MSAANTHLFFSGQKKGGEGGEERGGREGLMERPRTIVTQNASKIRVSVLHLQLLHIKLPDALHLQALKAKSIIIRGGR